MPGEISRSYDGPRDESQVVLTCVYCGHASRPGTPAAMHPMSAVVQERDSLRDELAEEKRDAASWKHSFEAQNGEIRRLSDEREDLDDAVARLEEIGNVVGCGHHDSPDGRLVLVKCVEQIVDGLEQQRDRLLSAIKEHWSQKADDRCIEDDARLYAAAGQPPQPSAPVGVEELMGVVKLYGDLRAVNPKVGQDRIFATVRRLAKQLAGQGADNPRPSTSNYIIDLENEITRATKELIAVRNLQLKWIEQRKKVQECLQTCDKTLADAWYSADGVIRSQIAEALQTLE